MSEVHFYKCPVCGFHRPAERKGSGRILRGKAADHTPIPFTFDRGNLEDGAFLSVREARGKPLGFVEVNRIPLKEFVRENINPFLIAGLKKKCLKILEIIKKNEKI